MAQHQRKHHRRHRGGRFGWIYGLISAVVILAAAIGGCIVFFRADQINVEGVSHYTAEEIIDIAGVKQGDNLYLMNKFKMIEKLEQQLVYVENVSIRRKLPSTLNIIVEEYTVAAALQDGADSQWWLISGDGRLLERVDDPGSYAQVSGITLSAPSEGTDLAVGEDQRLQQQALTGLLTALEDRELLSRVQTIDLSGGGVVTMGYDNRLTVKMNQSADFDYAVRALSTVMSDYVDAKWSADDTGTLDMTSEDGKPHLIKNAAEN